MFKILFGFFFFLSFGAIAAPKNAACSPWSSEANDNIKMNQELSIRPFGRVALLSSMAIEFGGTYGNLEIVQTFTLENYSFHVFFELKKNGALTSTSFQSYFQGNVQGIAIFECGNLVARLERQIVRDHSRIQMTFTLLNPQNEILARTDRVDYFQSRVQWNLPSGRPVAVVSRGLPLITGTTHKIQFVSEFPQRAFLLFTPVFFAYETNPRL